MRSSRDLAEILKRIDGRGYKAYKDIQGAYDFGWFTLYIDHVQGDPFASPSRLRARVPQSKAQIPEAWRKNSSRLVALEDYLTRQFARVAGAVARGVKGTGKSGLIAIDKPGQQVLPRTSMVVTPEYVESRFVVGLPASGRRVLGHQAETILCHQVPEIVRKSLLAKNLDSQAVQEHVEVVEDADYIREHLAEQGLVAFVANGSILPRASGISDKPMNAKEAVPFQSPKTLEVTFITPNHGEITGMGIKVGITLIVGGGYHGKSTLLRALEKGVYNHIPGDGREFVITNPNAVKIRAEDGRGVEKVKISPFIVNLPRGVDTDRFSTSEASGSTSQAANIIEALEGGAEVLLIDEDTSATNFMIRDVRMQQLVSKDKEPITPFIDKVRQIYTELGVSTVIVLGGSGDYFDVADTVVMMDEYCPRDVTAAAKQVAEAYRTERIPEGGAGFGTISRRCPLPESIDPTKGRGKIKIAARGVESIQFGREEINLRYLEQLVDPSQSRAIGDIIFYAKRYLDGSRSIREGIELVMQDIEREGLDVISPYKGQHPGDYALPRRHEVIAALNRLRTLKVQVKPE
ncbi:MAG: ABC-ATPase domain-containing protein [Firmicutes bacterium]|nr:ABC-ATPase domain-containing protein [Bacillota bacterium]